MQDGRSRPRACRGRRDGASPPVQGPAARGHRPIVAGRGPGVPDRGRPCAGPPVTCPDDPRPPDRPASPACCAERSPCRRLAPCRVGAASARPPAGPRARRRADRARPWCSSAPAASPGATSSRDGHPGAVVAAAATASSAALSVRSVLHQHLPGGRLADPVGRRSGPLRRGAGDGHADRARPSPARASPPWNGAVPGWDAYRRIAAAQGASTPRSACSATQLAPRRGCVQAVGAGAAVGAATSARARSPATRRTTPARCRATLAACPVDAGRRRRACATPADVAERRGAPERRRGPRRSGRVDARIGQVIEAAPERRRRASSRASRTPAPASGCGSSARAGPRFGPGTLESTSTRQAGLVQAARPHRDGPGPRGPARCPAAVGGSAAARGPGRRQLRGRGRDRLQHLVDYDQASPRGAPPRRRRSSTAVVLRPDRSSTPFVAAGLAAATAAPRSTRLRLLRLVRRVAIDRRAPCPVVDLPGQPAAVVALPHARCSPSSASVALFVAVISAIALLGPWRRSPARAAWPSSRPPRCSCSPPT